MKSIKSKSRSCFSKMEKLGKSYGIMEELRRWRLRKISLQATELTWMNSISQYRFLEVSLKLKINSSDFVLYLVAARAQNLPLTPLTQIQANVSSCSWTMNKQYNTVEHSSQDSYLTWTSMKMSLQYWSNQRQKAPKAQNRFGRTSAWKIPSAIGVNLK